MFWFLLAKSFRGFVGSQWSEWVYVLQDASSSYNWIQELEILGQHLSPSFILWKRTRGTLDEFKVFRGGIGLEMPPLYLAVPFLPSCLLLRPLLETINGASYISSPSCQVDEDGSYFFLSNLFDFSFLFSYYSD